jgi:hypothetical protein
LSFEASSLYNILIRVEGQDVERNTPIAKSLEKQGLEAS